MLRFQNINCENAARGDRIREAMAKSRRRLQLPSLRRLAGPRNPKKPIDTKFPAENKQH